MEAPVNASAAQKARPFPAAAVHAIAYAAALAGLAIVVAVVSSMPALVGFREEAGLGCSFAEEALSPEELSACLDSYLARFLPASTLPTAAESAG